MRKPKEMQDPEFFPKRKSKIEMKKMICYSTRCLKQKRQRQRYVYKYKFSREIFIIFIVFIRLIISRLVCIKIWVLKWINAIMYMQLLNILYSLLFKYEE